MRKMNEVHQTVKQHQLHNIRQPLALTSHIGYITRRVTPGLMGIVGSRPQEMLDFNPPALKVDIKDLR